MTATVRISNISFSTTAEALGRFLESHGLELASSRCPISLVDMDDKHKVATVSFANSATLQQALSLPFTDLELEGEFLDIDREFDGITVFSNGHDIDIIALHGLNGHAFDTWEYEGDHGENFMWLRDNISKRFSNTRVMTYGYNADVFSELSAGRVRSLAETFLEHISSARDEDSSRDRPLIIVAHSVGGLVVKQALIIAYSRADGRFHHILNATRSIIFLGTPHRGLDSATYSANLIDPNAPIPLLKYLDPSSMNLFDTTDDFVQLAERMSFQIFTVFELRKTTRGPPPIINVHERSAILGVAREIKIAVNADHSHLGKFKGVADTRLVVIARMIERLSTTARPDIPAIQRGHMRRHTF